MSAAAGFSVHHQPAQRRKEMTSLLIANGILAVTVLVVIVAMHAWAIAAERGPRVAGRLRAASIGPAPARTASLSIASAD
jgi:hypothetical protein